MAIPGGVSASYSGSPYNDFSGAPVAAGSAVQDAANPYADTRVNPMYALYPGWAMDETPSSDGAVRRNTYSYQANTNNQGLTALDASSYLEKPNLKTRLSNDPTEVVAWGDEGPTAQDLTPNSDGTQTNEPNNWSGRWPIPRILRAGVGYTFFRTWTHAATEKEGFDGSHVSLADNAVVLPVGGMAPQYRRNMRNTYRIDPDPWDVNMVDRNTDPTENASPPTGSVVPPNVGYHGSSWRLQ